MTYWWYLLKTVRTNVWRIFVVNRQKAIKYGDHIHVIPSKRSRRQLSISKISLHLFIFRLSNYGPVLIFSGGMPTASYGDRFTITLKTEKSLLVLDFPSKVLDFHVSKSPIHGKHDKTKYDSILIVLTEHEIVMVDIRDPQWRELPAQQYFPMDAHSVSFLIFFVD